MKYSYITLLNTENYLKGVLCLNESLKKTKAQYPLTVAITDEISKEILKILEKNGLQLVHINKMTVPEDIKEKNKKGIFVHWSNTFDKLQIFELTQFDKLVFLDSDMLIRNNIDELFEKENLSAVIDRREPNVIDTWKKLTSGTLVIEPKKGMVTEFLQVMNTIKGKRDSIGDQDILQEYDTDWENKENLHLDVKYNTFFIYLDYYIKCGTYNLEDISVVHFILKRKPWNLDSGKINDYLEFLNHRLQVNYEINQNDIFKKCLDIGVDNKKKILYEYMEILKTVNKNLEKGNLE